MREKTFSCANWNLGGSKGDLHMKKKLVSIALVVAMMVTSLTGCNGDNGPKITEKFFQVVLKRYQIFSAKLM